MGDGTPAGGSDAFCGGVGGVGVSAVDHHAGAVLRQQPRDSRADAPRPADHDRAPAGEQWGHSSLPKVIMSRFQYPRMFAINPASLTR